MRITIQHPFCSCAGLPHVFSTLTTSLSLLSQPLERQNASSVTLSTSKRTQASYIARYAADQAYISSILYIFVALHKMLSTNVILLLASIIPQALATYNLVQDYTGDAFYQNFQFFSNPDPTEGHVQYQTLEAANTTGLAGFMTSGGSNKAIFMSVDSEAVAPDGRGSVRVESKQSFNHALVIADIVHMPGGKSTLIRLP